MATITFDPLNLSNKCVAVIGPGVSGLSATKYLCAHHADVVLVGKGAPDLWDNFQNIKQLVGNIQMHDQAEIDLPALLSQCDLILLSPGIPREVAFLSLALKAQVPVWNEIELAFRILRQSEKQAGRAPCPIMAITGTNGKTTTVTLMGELGRSLFKNVFVGGNIGLPFMEAVSKGENWDLIILELSSFQAESLEDFHPQVAAILNIAQNHGERYQHIQDYATAKFKIARKMQAQDLMILGRYDGCNCRNELTQYLTTSCSNGPLPIIETFENDELLKIKKYVNGIVAEEDIKIPGDHNLKNVFVAFKCFEHLDLIDKEKFKQVLRKFMGVPHRLERVESSGPFIYYNDAKSTNWQATLTAVGALKDRQPLYLILGGQLRGQGDAVTPYLPQLKAVTKFFLIGQAGQSIYDEMEDKMEVELSGSLAQALESVQRHSPGTVLFSPAFPSFDQFKNYTDRGQVFKSLVVRR